jgi:hypothetical protein
MTHQLEIRRDTLLWALILMLSSTLALWKYHWTIPQPTTSQVGALTLRTENSSGKPMGNPIKLSDLSANHPTVQLYYQNVAGLPTDEINSAFESAKAAFHPVQIQYAPMPENAAAPEGAYYRVVFTNHSARGKMNADIGGESVDGARLMYVYPNELGDYKDEAQRAISHVLMHELGHSLGGLQHSLTGIMAPRFTDQDLQVPAPPLSKSQLKRVGITLRNLAKTK